MTTGHRVAASIGREPGPASGTARPGGTSGKSGGGAHEVTCVVMPASLPAVPAGPPEGAESVDNSRVVLVVDCSNQRALPAKCDGLRWGGAEAV